MSGPVVLTGLGFALATALLVGACAPSPPTGAGPAAASTASKPAAAAQPPSTEKVRVGTLPVTSVSAHFIAKEKGYYAAQGIEIEEIESRSSAARLQGTIAGEMEVSTTGFDPDVLSAILQGAPIRMVRDIAQERPGFAYNFWLIRKDLYDGGQVREVKDFKGKSITLGQQRGAIGEYDLRLALASAGLTMNDIQFVVMNHPDVPNALAGRAVDIALSLDPFATAAQESGSAVLLTDATTFYPDRIKQTAVQNMNTKFMDTRRDVAQRFTNAWNEGAAFLMDALENGTNKDEMHAIVSKHTKLPLEVIQKVGFPATDRQGYLADKAALDQLNFYFGEKLIPKQVTSIDEITDYRFLPKR